MPSTARLLPFAFLLVAGGCAAATPDPRYPSLLPRTIETRSDAEPEAVAVVVVPDPATDARIAAWRKTFDGNSATFVRSAAAADRAANAARGDPVGTERWIAAQAALAELDALRATTSSLSSEIDDLAIARAADGQPPYPALETLRGDVQAAGEAQGARIATIQARLPTA